MRPLPSRVRQGGIALMLVIWGLTLLVVIALSLTLTQRTEIALSANQVESARFRTLAEAATAYTALHYLTPAAEADQGQETAWLPDGQTRTWSFAGHTLLLQVFDESARYDLNQVPHETLRRLLTVLGVEDAEADALAARIIDWRDPDEQRLLNGAEDPDYRQAGRPFGAKDAPFETVEELKQVLGMTPEIYALLAPEVSVDGGSLQPNERFASAAVLATLRGISLEEAFELIAERNQTQRESGARSLDRGGPVYRLRVSIQTGGSNRRIEILFQLIVGQDPPYHVIWRRYDLFLGQFREGGDEELSHAG
ncbi:general secretion pathway protein GspK [Caldichromatium japonicum]|uniref:general secretion pathway protein GspK n=1 Tax=Caldichromatium japonicum TaxID=2699430 RepID=UPI001FE75CF6|nr:type II secretion system protein GspK [Caldichromatium japonicum]